MHFDGCFGGTKKVSIVDAFLLLDHAVIKSRRCSATSLQCAWWAPIAGQSSHRGVKKGKRPAAEAVNSVPFSAGINECVLHPVRVQQEWNRASASSVRVEEAQARVPGKSACATKT